MQNFIASAIQRAASYIDLHGLAIGVHNYSRGAADVVGALRETTGEWRPAFYVARTIIERHIKDMFGKELHKWSDSTNKNEVVRVLQDLAWHVEYTSTRA